MILRLLNVQGLVGLAASAALALLLIVQASQARHWKKESARFEQLYSSEQAALATTVANYRAAADRARAADQANLARVGAEQRSINERTAHDYEARLAAARLSAQRLRQQAAAGPADPGAGRAAAVPGVPAPSRGVAEASREDRFSIADRELATEQAIQLDELVKWIRAQANVGPNAPSR